MARKKVNIDPQQPLITSFTTRGTAATGVQALALPTRASINQSNRHEPIVIPGSEDDEPRQKRLPIIEILDSDDEPPQKPVQRQQKAPEVTKTNKTVSKNGAPRKRRQRSRNTASKRPLEPDSDNDSKDFAPPRRRRSTEYLLFEAQTAFVPDTPSFTDEVYGKNLLDGTVKNEEIPDTDTWTMQELNGDLSDLDSEYESDDGTDFVKKELAPEDDKTGFEDQETSFGIESSSVKPEEVNIKSEEANVKSEDAPGNHARQEKTMSREEYLAQYPQDDLRQSGLKYKKYNTLDDTATINKEVLWVIENDKTGELKHLKRYANMAGSKRSRLQPKYFTTKGRFRAKYLPKRQRSPSRDLSLGKLPTTKTDDELREMFNNVPANERGRLEPTVFSCRGDVRKEYYYLINDKAAKIKEWKAAETLSDKTLVEIYCTLSEKARFNVAPHVFDHHGQPRRQYKHLWPMIKSAPAPIRDLSHQHSWKTRNRPFMAHITIEDTKIFSGCFETHPMSETEHIVVGFTRTSGAAPVYGLPGMFLRAMLAADAYAENYLDGNVVKLAIPRQATSSRKHFFDAGNIISQGYGTALDELWSVLDAAAFGRHIVLLAVGFDAFTTNMSNLIAIADKWAHLRVELVIAVPRWFMGSYASFPIAENGIRYGHFWIQDIKDVVQGVKQLQNVREFVNILKKVNQAKMHLMYRHYLFDYTVGRSNFRVSPHTTTNTGVPDDFSWDDLRALLDQRRNRVH